MEIEMEILKRNTIRKLNLEHWKYYARFIIYRYCVRSRSSRSQMFFITSVLKNFAIFTGEHLCWSLFLIKLQACNFIKKRPQYRCFPVNIVKFLRTTFFYRTPPVATSKGRMFLKLSNTFNLVTKNHITLRNLRTLSLMRSVVTRIN